MGRIVGANNDACPVYPMKFFLFHWGEMRRRFLQGNSEEVEEWKNGIKGIEGKNGIMEWWKSGRMRCWKLKAGSRKEVMA